jgi:hypothetical protein
VIERCSPRNHPQGLGYIAGKGRALRSTSGARSAVSHRAPPFNSRTTGRQPSAARWHIQSFAPIETLPPAVECGPAPPNKIVETARPPRRARSHCRFVVLHQRAFTAYQIHLHTRCLYYFLKLQCDRTTPARAPCAARGGRSSP